MWPWDWVIGAGNAIAGISQKVYDWVTSQITAVMSWVMDAINSIWASISALWSEVERVAESIASGLVDIATSFTAWISSAITGVLSWAEGKIAELWSYARGVYNWAIGEFDHLRSLISDAVSGVLSWVDRNIWQPLNAAYRDVRNFVDIWIPRIWQYFQHPELIADLVGAALLRLWQRYVLRLGPAIARWLIHEMMKAAGEVFDLLEYILSSII
jgi:hypothetical protein